MNIYIEIFHLRLYVLDLSCMHTKLHQNNMFDFNWSLNNQRFNGGFLAEMQDIFASCKNY